VHQRNRDSGTPTGGGRNRISHQERSPVAAADTVAVAVAGAASEAAADPVAAPVAVAAILGATI